MMQPASQALQQQGRCLRHGCYPRGTRAIHCYVSKTTSGRSTQPGSQQSQESKPSSRRQQNKPLQDHARVFREQLGSWLSYLTPKQEGDIGDVLMISLSLAVLIYFSMQLYRLYAYAYFHAGSYQTMMDMMQ